jgi:NAD(P)-dependent dehydrogenase (short-subunit alcohol dehydrogenase family)
VVGGDALNWADAGYVSPHPEQALDARPSPYLACTYEPVTSWCRVDHPRDCHCACFVTGATGYIGSAVVRELLEAGHQIIGLARSDTAAAALSAVGLDVHRGDLEDLDSLPAGAAAADGVIFATNQHISETTDSAARANVELNAVEAIGSALEGTNKPFAVTSGVIGRTSERILVAGAGGGFDVYAGLALALALIGLGKTVHLANLSFSALDLIDVDDWCEPNLAAIKPTTRGHNGYFPERTLARWLDSQDLNSTVYAFPRTGSPAAAGRVPGTGPAARH